jgi:hypothetical protein
MFFLNDYNNFLRPFNYFFFVINCNNNNNNNIDLLFGQAARTDKRAATCKVFGVK